MGTEVERQAGERTQYSTQGNPLPPRALTGHVLRFLMMKLRNGLPSISAFVTLKQKVLWNSRWPPSRGP